MSKEQGDDIDVEPVCKVDDRIQDGPAESKTRTYHGRVAAGRRTAEWPGEDAPEGFQEEGV